MSQGDQWRVLFGLFLLLIGGVSCLPLLTGLSNQTEQGANKLILIGVGGLFLSIVGIGALIVTRSKRDSRANSSSSDTSSKQKIGIRETAIILATIILVVLIIYRDNLPSGRQFLQMVYLIPANQPSTYASQSTPPNASSKQRVALESIAKDIADSMADLEFDSSLHTSSPDYYFWKAVRMSNYETLSNEGSAVFIRFQYRSGKSWATITVKIDSQFDEAYWEVLDTNGPFY